MIGEERNGEVIGYVKNDNNNTIVLLVSLMPLVAQSVTITKDFAQVPFGIFVTEITHE